MSASAVSAGKAFLRLMIDDTEFRKGLDGSIKHLDNFGKSATKIGATLGAVGASITAPFVASIKVFSDVGGALADMQGRTGLSAESLTELKYAAEQTGASLETVEKAARKMQKDGLDPNLIFDYAREIAAIKDPVRQAQAAMDRFGKSGTQLLPMIAQMDSLREQARKLGITWSQEMVDNADRFGDAMGALKVQLATVGHSIAAAVAPAVSSLAERFSEALPRVIEFVQQNRELVVAVGASGAGLTALGGTVASLGLALQAVTGAMTGLRGGMALVAAHPLAAAIVALAAALYAVAVATGETWRAFENAGEGPVDKINRLRSEIAALEEEVRRIGPATGNTMEDMANQIPVEKLRLAREELQIIYFDLLRIGKLPGFGFGGIVGGGPIIEERKSPLTLGIEDKAALNSLSAVSSGLFRVLPGLLGGRLGGAAALLPSGGAAGVFGPQFDVGAMAAMNAEFATELQRQVSDQMEGFSRETRGGIGGKFAEQIIGTSASDAREERALRLEQTSVDLLGKIEKHLANGKPLIAGRN